MLDFRVNTFLTVCESKNYTKAAEKLGLTQPAVTQHIKYIEEKYKVRLFVKDGKNMRLTKSGELLRDMLITLSADSNRIDERIKKIADEPKLISMGATKAIGQYVMPHILEKYLDQNPQIKISMEVENTSRLLSMLKTGRLEFAIVEGQFDKSMYWYKLFSNEKYICICSPKSELGDRTVSIEELFNKRLIVRESGSGARNILENHLSQMGFSFDNFKPYLELGSIEAIKRLVGDDYGIAFTYEAAAKEELKRGKLKQVHVKGCDLTHEFNFVCLRDTMFLKEFEDFFDFAVNSRQ